MEITQNMEKLQACYLNALILFLGLFTYSPLVISPVQTSTINTNYLLSNTELNISHVELNYYIHSTGGYSCYFTLDAVGNSLTGSNFAICEFLIHGLSLEGICPLSSRCLPTGDAFPESWF